VTPPSRYVDPQILPGFAPVTPVKGYYEFLSHEPGHSDTVGWI